MTRLIEEADTVQKWIRNKRWEFCFIGGLAVLRWGEPRLTHDIDITLLTEFKKEEEYVDAFLAEFLGRRPDTREFALKNRVLLLKTSNGIPVDIALGGLPFEKEAVERSSSFEFNDRVHLFTCSAEDLIVMKAFANRPRDWLDVEGIIIRQNTKLDWEYTIRQLIPLCEAKEEPEIVDRLSKMRRSG